MGVSLLLGALVDYGYRIRRERNDFALESSSVDNLFTL